MVCSLVTPVFSCIAAYRVRLIVRLFSAELRAVAVYCLISTTCPAGTLLVSTTSDFAYSTVKLYVDVNHYY